MSVDAVLVPQNRQEQIRTWAKALWGTAPVTLPALAILGYALLNIVGVVPLSTAADISIVVFDVLALWLGTPMITGYRPATSDELAAIRAGNLWHLTPTVVPVDGVVELDAERCRWICRMRYRTTPWRRRSPAVFAFRARPTQTQASGNVTRRRRGHLLKLDGSVVTNAWIRESDNSVALLDGYIGPAVEVTDAAA